jgi:hypothetical protein
VTNTATGSCANGLTGFTAPPAGPASLVNGDIDFTVPSLIGDAAQAVLRQVNFCTNYNFGPFSGAINRTAAQSLWRARQVDLTLPAVNAAGPSANGTLNFDITPYTWPGLTTDGDIALELTTLFITNLTGVIKTVLGPNAGTHTSARRRHIDYPLRLSGAEHCPTHRQL